MNQTANRKQKAVIPPQPDIRENGQGMPKTTAEQTVVKEQTLRPVFARDGSGFIKTFTF